MPAQIFLIAPVDADVETCLQKLDEALAATTVAALLIRAAAAPKAATRHW